MKEVIILFGEMGGGKNYWGSKLALENKYEFFDGDTVLPPAMLEKVTKFKPLDRVDIALFVNNLAAETVRRLKHSDGIVLAQALYLDSDRKFLATYLRKYGFSVKFIWVKPPFIRNMRQIFSRKNGFKWVLYWLINKPFFQKPTHFYNIKK